MTRILIVDDSPHLLSVLAQGLERSGFEVVTADDGEAAMRLVEDAPPAAVVTDIVMPGQEGLETIRALQARHPGIPIVAMSGRGFAAADRTDVLHAARAFGAGEVLQKPFRIAELVEALARLAVLPERDG